MSEERYASVMDKSVVEDIVSSGEEYENTTQRLSDLETMKKRNAKLLQGDVLRLSLEESNRIVRENEMVNVQNAKRTQQVLQASLVAAVGSLAAGSISKNFINKAGTSGYDKAAKELIKEVVKVGKKYAGAGKKYGSVGLFKSSKGSLGKIQKLSKSGGRTSRQAGKLARKADSVIEKKKEKMIQGALKRMSKGDAKDLVKKIAKDANIEKKAKRQIKLGFLIDMQMRAMRRAARKMRANARRMSNTAAADPDISLTASGRNAIQLLGMDVGAVNRYADMGAQMVSDEASIDKSVLQLDALLREGQAALSAAKMKSNTVSQGLVYQRDNQKVRA